MKNLFIILCSLSVALSSCFKKEKPIALPAGTTEIKTVFLGKNYEKELYFDLSSNTYQEAQLAEWDLCFDASKDGWGIYVNSGTNAVLKNLNLYNLTEPKSFDTSGYIKNLDTLTDSPDGRPENTGIGKWQDKYITVGADNLHVIYIIQLPYLSGSARYKRLQFLAVTDTSYVFKISELYENGSPAYNGKIVEVKKSEDHNFIYYCFNHGGYTVQNAEPNKNSWDIEFTRYKHIFTDLGPKPFPYLVNGVLSNKNNVAIAKDSITLFEDIDAAKVSQYTFTTDRNGIGYDWKTFDRNGSLTYTVNSRITYIIRDTDGQFYKLRFLDFYNELREKGYPKFEFMRIK